MLQVCKAISIEFAHSNGKKIPICRWISFQFSVIIEEMASGESKDHKMYHTSSFRPPFFPKLPCVSQSKDEFSWQLLLPFAMSWPKVLFINSCSGLSLWNIKSDNLQYNTIGCWDKWLMDQTSDVPSIILFHNFLQNSLQKTFKYIFLFFY